MYARSTILGEKTGIGRNSVDGGSVFITKSVAQGSQVFYIHQLRINTQESLLQKKPDNKEAI